MNADVRRKCINIPDIIEILLVTPFSNAKLQAKLKMFSRMHA